MSTRIGNMLALLLIVSLAMNVYFWRQLPPSDVTAANRNASAERSPEASDDPASLAQWFRRSQQPALEPLSLDDYALLIENAEFESVLALRGEAGVTAEQNAAIDQLWLQQTERWLAEDELALANQSINAFLRERPFDPGFRYLRAQWLSQSGSYLEAIPLFYSLLNESPPERQGKFVSAIQTLVSEQVKLLSEAKAWPQLQALVDSLLWHEPSHPPYIILQARLNISLENYAEARSGLRSLLYDEQYGARAEELLEQLARVDLEAIGIKLAPQGEHYVVTGRVNNNNGVQLLVDTGASVSVLSTKTFQQLSAQLKPVFVRRTKMNTAGGVVEAPIYQFESFAIEDYIVRNMQFAVMSLPVTHQSDGLLGMNFLRNYDFRIDQNNQLLLLAPR